MNTNVANGLAAHANQAVTVGAKATKQASKLAKLFATGPQTVASSLTKEASTATFQQALNKTLTAVVGEPQETLRVTPLKNRASIKTPSSEGSTSRLGGSIARTRKSVSMMRSSGGTVLGQTSARNQDGESATTASGDTAKTSRTRRSAGWTTPVRPPAQTSDGPVKTDKKNQASLKQEETESQGTSAGLQGGQPAACPDPSIAASTDAVPVQNSLKLVVTDDPVMDQDSKAKPMVKIAGAAEKIQTHSKIQTQTQTSTDNATATVPKDTKDSFDRPLQKATQLAIGTKAQEGSIALTASMDRMGTGLQPTSGKSENGSDGSSKTSELHLATSSTQTGGTHTVSGQVVSRVTHTPHTADEGSGQPKDSPAHLRLETNSQQQGDAGDRALNMTSTVSVESSKDQGQVVELKSTLQSSGGRVASQVRADGQGLHMDLHQQGSQGLQDTKQILSSSNTLAVERGADPQGHTEASREARPFGEAMDKGSINLDGLTLASSVQSVKLSSQGVPQKDPVRAAGRDGPSAVQTQIWPNAGLTVESLTDLGGPIPGQIDDSVMQQLVEDHRPSLHEQVVSSIRGALETQTHQLSVELNPPELGKVLIRFEQHEGSLTGLLEVENRATAADLKQALPEILQNLHNSGIQVKHLDVLLNDQNQRSSRDSAFADMYQGRSGQQDQGRPWPYTDQALYPTGSPASSAVSTEPGRPQASIRTDGSIDLLM